MRLNERYKPLLAVYIVWHPSFEKGKLIADSIYTYLSRNTDAPLIRGIGIPVFFRSIPQRSNKTPKEINLNEADYNAIVVLVDDCLFNDEDWNIYVKELIPKTDNKNRIFPIAFSDNAYYFEESTLGREQFISAKGVEIERNFSHILAEIKSRLVHGFCRLLLEKQPIHEAEKELNEPAPVKLFISHAKKDGEKEAKAFRDFVRANTKLSTFFDANDIADGYKFDTQIKKAIEDGQAAMVVFHSDEYAAREWCQIEVLTAKRYKSPIVVVHNISVGELRSFPYLGNVPTIKLNEANFSQIIDLTLYQILLNIFQRENLKRIKALYVPKRFESIELTSPPELFNFIDILSQKSKSKSGKFLVLYPDPPLGIDEMRVLNDFDSTIQFLTPIQLSTLIK